MASSSAIAANYNESSSAEAPSVGHHISSATYPFPEPLTIRLKAGILLPPPQFSSSSSTSTTTSQSQSPAPPQQQPPPEQQQQPSTQQRQRAIVDTVQDALAHLVSNSIEALDAMYFSTPARIRKHLAFTHRLCLRVCATKNKNGSGGGTLSLTDLGVGMTRADLINSLGIGRAGLLSTTSASYGPASASSSTSGRVNGESGGGIAAVHRSDTDSTASDREDYLYGSELEEDEDDENGHQALVPTSPPHATAPSKPPAPTEVNNDTTSNTRLSCRSTELGGFYAALCSLGVGVRVGTKAKHDEYYEFDVGYLDDNDATVAAPNRNDDPSSWDALYSQFRIRRPFAEGVALTVENGFDQFENVRGESGTCITLQLNSDAVEAGLLDENTLKPLFLNLLQTTQYTVAFSSDDSANAIIEASGQEDVAIAALLQQPEDPLEAVADMDLGPRRMKQRDYGSDDGTTSTSKGGSYNSVKERAKYIPLRLSLGERKMLRLIEASMCCCEYTTDVDRPFKSAARRTHEQLKGVTSILRGLVTACDYEAGQKLLRDDHFVEFDNFFRQMFEIARRHKIMNPEKMRTEYGKLVYLLQDAVSPSIKPHLGFSVKGPIQSVYKFLEGRGGLDMLSDKLIETATEEILAERKSRSQIEQEIRQKERAVAILKRKYKTTRLSVDDIHLCLYSICDNNSFLNSNRVPIDKIIDYLTTHFSPTRIEDGYSLSIVSGEDGARLSHSHERQYYYALQSLTLWRDIIDDMFRLWAMAEEDLLSESVTYSLQDTGQGMQRVQQSPRTYQAMQQILQRVQHKVSHWVGSSVIHLGDHNVPNSLSFIDKYTQVPRILGPIVACLENLERICEQDDGIQRMIDNGFGGLEKLRMDILYDFFRSAFDGSGADNFYDAGSCIDGRLTSAWNWCSQLPNKPFYPIFKLTGFIGFDGEFK